MCVQIFHQGTAGPRVSRSGAGSKTPVSGNRYSLPIMPDRHFYAPDFIVPKAMGADGVKSENGGERKDYQERKQ